MESKELVISFPTELGTINDKALENVRQYVIDVATPYIKAIVTEDNLAEMTKIKADLNKVYTQIEDERKAIKRTWNNPLDAFEKQVKEAEKPLLEAINGIKIQIDGYEEDRKNKKRDKLVQMIYQDARDFRADLDNVIGNLVIWNRIWNDAFLNKTVSENKAQESWRSNLRAIMTELDTIADDSELLEFYLKTGSVTEAMQEQKAKKAREEQVDRLHRPRPSFTASHQSEVVIQEIPKEENPFMTDGKDVKIFTTKEPSAINDGDRETVRAKRIYQGEYWKIMKVFEYAEALGIEVIKEEK